MNANIGQEIPFIGMFNGFKANPRYGGSRSVYIVFSAGPGLFYFDDVTTRRPRTGSASLDQALEKAKSDALQAYDDNKAYGLVLGTGGMKVYNQNPYPSLATVEDQLVLAGGVVMPLVVLWVSTLWLLGAGVTIGTTIAVKEFADYWVQDAA